jgi:NADH-quinone oxidoreductase subunit K
VDAGLGHFAALSAVLFAIGSFGLLARRNLLGVLLSAQVMIVAATVALAAFARFGYGGTHPLGGAAFAFFVIAGSAGEVLVAVALLLLLHRRRDTLNSDELDDLRG